MMWIDVIVLLVLGSVLVKWSLLLSVIVYGLLLFQLLVVTKIRTRVFDGQDLSEIQAEDIRSHIMYQPQDQFLMSGTILDNIVWGDESYDLEEVNQAIHKARVAEFIQTLPDGLNTYIGEISSSVSGGQAQRIALARLFYRRPKIIILDEPTSFIDVAGKTLFNELVTDLKGYSTIV